MKKIITLIFLAILVTPGVIQVFNIPIDVHLNGSKYKDPDIAFNTTNLLNGSFQNYFEEILKKTNNLYGFLVKTEKQLNFSLFQQSGLEYKAGVAIGNNNELIEKPYLNSYNFHSEIKPSKIKRKLKLINNSSNFLVANSISMFSVITPNKPEFYPEVIADKYLIPNNQRRPNFYHLARDLITTDGKNFILLPEILKENPARMFTASGTHLNEYANCLTAQLIIKQINSYQKHNIPELSCEFGKKIVAPYFMDTDLALLLNIWTPEKIYQDAPRTLHHKLLKEQSYDKPKVLIIGTSFIWGIKRYFTENHYFPKLDFIYYFKTLHEKNGKIKPFLCQSGVFDSYFKNFDYIILEANQAKFRELGFGFMECLMAEAKRSKQGHYFKSKKKISKK